MESQIVLVGLVTPEIPTQPFDSEKSWLLGTMTTYRDLEAFMFLAPGLTKDKSLTLFPDILPRDGRFDLEIGVELPDILPNLDGKVEYVLPVALKDGSVRDVCVSNSMVRVRYEDKGVLKNTLAPRCAVDGLRQGKYETIPKDCSVELLRTVVTTRYVIDGATADEAMTMHCLPAMEDFIERINVIRAAMQYVHPQNLYSASYCPANLPPFFILLVGDGPLSGMGTIAPHGGRTMRNPSNLRAECSSKVRAIAAGTETIDDIEALLHAADSFVYGGSPEFVLLLSVVAAEVATARYVDQQLTARGISNKKLKEAKKNNLTFSFNKNIMLKALVPSDKLPDDNLIAKLNEARSMRNDFMHEGIVPNRKQAVNFLATSRKYVAWIRSLESAVTVPDNKSNTAH